MSKSKIKPDFDVLLTIDGQTVFVESLDLHYSRKDSKKYVFFIDKETNCIVSFLVKRKYVYCDFDEKKCLGYIIKKDTKYEQK